MSDKPNPFASEPILSFASAAEFGAWLTENHARVPALRLKIHKKSSGLPTVTYEEAVREALCWGWIDGVKHPFDDMSFLQRFTPRRPRGSWSKRNVGWAEDLMAEERVAPPGLAEIEAAKADGRWDAAYSSHASMVLPVDLLAAIEAEPKAAEALARLSSQNRFALYYRVTTAKKPETRARRIAQFVEMLARGDTPYPQKAGTVGK